MPEEAWNVLEVSRLRRAIEDESYRDEVLREKGIVRPGHPFLSSPHHIRHSVLSA